MNTAMETIENAFQISDAAGMAAVAKYGPETLRAILMEDPDMSDREVNAVADDDLADCVARMWIH